MKNNGIFDKYYSRLVKEGVIKSGVCGLITGFAVMFAVALLSWIFGFAGGIWLALGLFVACSAAVGVAFYFLKFKPTSKQIARRVDALGLEERTITMLDLENDNSYLAMRQREDARERLAAVGSKSLPIVLPTLMIVLVAVFGVLGASMTTVMELAALNILPSGMEMANPDSRYDYIAVSYFAEEGGEIEGEADQIIERGASATSVLAVAEDGWEFIGWDDGVTDPYREDLNVSEDLFVMAIFERLGDGNGDEDGDRIDNAGGENGDIPTDRPGGSDSDGNDGGDAETGNGEGDGKGEVNGSGDVGDEGIEGGNGTGNGAGGGKYDPDNQIIDGNTHYEDELNAYLETLKEMLENNKELTDADKEFIEKYFGGL